MSLSKQFKEEVEIRIIDNESNEELKHSAKYFLQESLKAKYSYNFSWMGRPIIAYPQDMIAMQEIIWNIQPDLIIETGVAHGGSIVFYASLLALLNNGGKVIGIDIDIREHNKQAIESHPMSKYIELIEGSSIEKGTFDRVKESSKGYKKILVCLDSNHTHDHVLNELKLYSSLVTPNSYCVVFDTVVEHMEADFDWGQRPWSKGNNPQTAVDVFLADNPDFKIDKMVDNKILVSVATNGFLKRLK